MYIPIESSALGCIVLAIEPKLDFESRLQKHKDGVPQWTIRTFFQNVGDVAKVTVTSAEPPSFRIGAPITFIDMFAGVYGTANGRAGFFFTASGCTQ